MGTTTSFFDFSHDTARDVVTSQKLRRPTGILVSLGIAPTLFLIVSCRTPIQIRDVFEHEPLPVTVPEHASFAAHPFSDKNASDTRRPDHAGRMELDKFHIQQIRARPVGKRMTVPRVLPTVTSDLKRPTNTSTGQHNRAGTE